MGKGYAEGPAAEAAAEQRDRGFEPRRAPQATLRPAVFGSTADQPDVHFLGWADDVDADELFASGTAWGLTIRHLADR